MILEVLKYLGATGTGGVVAAFVLRFAWRKLFEESAAAQRTVWEGEFVAMLRAEIERQAAVNAVLYRQAGEMHLRIVELMGENLKLKTELAALDAQPPLLTETA